MDDAVALSLNPGLNVNCVIEVRPAATSQKGRDKPHGFHC